MKAYGVNQIIIYIRAALLLTVSLPALTWAERDIQSLFDVRTPMRDGVELSSDIWLPEPPGQYPLILIRTPYLKTSPATLGDANSLFADFAGYFVKHGYAVAVQDVRGRGDSDGDFDFFFQEAQDGYDTVEWLAAQPWSNGDVCMAGVSYLGTVQWLAAREKPPHLKCIVPTAAAGDYMYEIPYKGGAFHLSWALGYLNGVSGHVNQSPNAVHVDWETLYRHRPLLTADKALGRPMRLYREFLQHPTRDAYWNRIYFSPKDFRGIDIPVLHVTGWFDGDQIGAMYYWRGMQKYAKQNTNQFLIVGPWNHGQTFVGGETEIGEMKLTPDSVVDNKAVHLAFFDHYLKGKTTTFDSPRARLYITGVNEWRDYPGYPVPGVTEQRLFLASDGRANSLQGDGRLSWEKETSENPDSFVYNPAQPIPFGSRDGGQPYAVDRRPLQRRDDVLVYTSAVLEEKMEVIGPVYVEFYAASDARDTDFMAAVTDVYPDGRAIALGPIVVGAVRARYRDGEEEKLLTPGKIEKYRIRLGDLGHAFMPGHRIRLEITSSAFPGFSANPNTGNPIATDTAPMRSAHQTIHHGSNYPSALVLPVVNSRPPPE